MVPDESLRKIRLRARTDSFGVESEVSAPRYFIQDRFFAEEVGNPS